MIEHLLLTKKTVSMNLPSHTMTCVVVVGKNKVSTLSVIYE